MERVGGGPVRHRKAVRCRIGAPSRQICGGQLLPNGAGPERTMVDRRPWPVNRTLSHGEHRIGGVDHPSASRDRRDRLCDHTWSPFDRRVDVRDRVDARIEPVAAVRDRTMPLSGRRAVSSERPMAGATGRTSLATRRGNSTTYLTEGARTTSVGPTQRGAHERQARQPATGSSSMPTAQHGRTTVCTQRATTCVPRPMGRWQSTSECDPASTC
jgi:hypothetical protein